VIIGIDDGRTDPRGATWTPGLSSPDNPSLAARRPPCGRTDRPYKGLVDGMSASQHLPPSRTLRPVPLPRVQCVQRACRRIVHWKRMVDISTLRRRSPPSGPLT